jgi:hypothetical protein
MNKLAMKFPTHGNLEGGLPFYPARVRKDNTDFPASRPLIFSQK